MPNDIYQWETAGGLVHHCPQCFKPLTTPQARSRCLGEHVEWCKQYHTQLFKKGTSSQCEPCRRSDEEHTKRHREIAEKIHELKQLKTAHAPTSPLTPRAINILPYYNEVSPMTKKDRKAAKKAKKISEMEKVVSSTDIDFVSKVLHPHDAETDQLEIERQLVDDPDIKLNRFFHRGTSNTRDIRNEFVKQDRRSGKVMMHVDPEEIDGLLQLLNVSPLTLTARAEEKMIVAGLRKNIEDDLVHVQKEKEAMMMRKAGFWRWASKKAYKRLLQHGGIWSDKDDDSGDNSTSSSTTADADADTDTNMTEAETDITTSSEESLTTTMSRANLQSDYNSDPSTNTPQKVDDGWTRVGKTSKIQTPIGNLRLVHNGGLGKLAQSPISSRRPFNVSSFAFDGEL